MILAVLLATAGAVVAYGDPSQIARAKSTVSDLLRPRALATRGEMTKASDDTRAPAQASFASAPEQTPPDRTRGN